MVQFTLFATQLRGVLALVAVMVRYYASIARPARRELLHWRTRAQTIPDPALRVLALEKLSAEQLNAQAASVFATLAPRRFRGVVARLTVTFEIMYDYLDGASEWPCTDPIANGLQLHAALMAAVTDPLASVDFYAHHPRRNGDGGYLDELAARSRDLLARLPARSEVLPVLVAAVERCGAGQTRTHAAGLGDAVQLREWASSPDRKVPGYKWWELAAGAASSLAIHALVASAADRRTTRARAMEIDRAYWPSICSLSTLLDSLIDHTADVASGEHSYIAYYRTADLAGERLAAIAREGASGVRQLLRPQRHLVIAAGVVGFYLSAIPSCRGEPARAAPRILDAFSPGLMRPIVAVVRFKRR